MSITRKIIEAITVDPTKEREIWDWQPTIITIFQGPHASQPYKAVVKWQAWMGRCAREQRIAVYDIRDGEWIVSGELPTRFPLPPDAV